ncbi:hypothetical protein [Helicobacter pylori]|uniref:hypothetical protein n=1 Tax=Helicobacter pylori TaxID=210 RepID=UPI0039DF7BD5
MAKTSSYRKRKAESKVKDQIIESLNRELDAKNQANESKDRIIESKNEAIVTQKETIGTLKRENAFLTEGRYQDEEKEHSKFCLGLE